MRILVVEDEPRLAELIRRGLVAEGFVVQVAGDGRVGFDEAVGGGFDVLVLDIMLPSMSGYEIVRDLRKADVWTRCSCCRPRTGGSTTWPMHSTSARMTT